MSDTDTLNNLLAAAKAASTSAHIDAGVYSVANASGAAVTLDLSDLVAAAVSERRRPNVLGDGIGSTVIVGQSAGQYAMKVLGGTGISSQHLITIGDMTFGGAAGARGLHIYNSAFIRGRDMAFHGLNYGLNLESVLSSTFEHLHFYSCGVGLQLSKGTGFSYANALSFNKCIFGLNTANGVSGLPNSTNVVFNQCNFEGNGTQGNSYAGGCVLTFDGQQGRVGATFDGCWFEANKGGFDVRLVNNGPGVMTHVFKNCNFTKSVASEFVTNNIQSYGRNRIVLIGCSFESYNGYTPSASRPYVYDNGATEWKAIGCAFDSPVEQGSLTNIL